MKFLFLSAAFFCSSPFLCAGGAPALLSAKTADAIVAAEEQERRDAEFRHLDELRSFVPKVQFQRAQGKDTLIFNCILAPILPRKYTRKIVQEAPMSLDDFLEMNTKTLSGLYFSATVYDEQVTELVLYDQGRKFHAFVNINFFHLQEVGQVETADSVYPVCMSLYSGDGYEEDRDVPVLGDFSPNKIEFLLAPDSELSFEDKAFGGIDALCYHYLQNKPALEVAYQHRKELSAARERYRQAHPEKPKEIIFNFWKK